MLRKSAVSLALIGCLALAFPQGAPRVEAKLRLVAKGVDNGSLSPDGRSLLVHGTDGVLSLLELDTGRSRKLLSINSMIERLDPAGKRIVMQASAAFKGADYYGLWTVGVDGSGLRPFLKEPDLRAEERFPIWSDDGASVAWARDGRIWIAAADGSGARAATPEKKGSFGLPLDWMGGRLLFSMSDDAYHASTLRLLDLRTGKIEDTGLRGDGALFYGSPDRIVRYDGALVVWDLATGREAGRIELGQELESLWSFERSADCARFLLSVGDAMDTTIQHLYLLEAEPVPPAAPTASASGLRPQAPAAPFVFAEAPELSDLAAALRATLPAAPAAMRGLISLPAGYPADRALALERLNRYRLGAGLRPYAYDARLSEMGQAHADYIFANAGSGAEGSHFELTGYRGYTKGGDEAARTSGIALGVQDPLAALEKLMGGAFHRLQFLRPEETLVGLGHSYGPPAASTYARGGALFVTREASDPASIPRPRFVLFPPDGFDDAPTAFAEGENPDPRPGRGPGAPDTGYPITIGLVRDDIERFQGASAALLDERGNELAVWLSYPGAPAVARPDLGIYEGDGASIAKAYRENFGAVFILPKSPLEKGMAYAVRAELQIGGKKELLSWSFRTRGATLWTARPEPAAASGSLGSALASATEGDTIRLAAGEYRIRDPLILKKPIRLVGEPGRTSLRFEGGSGMSAMAIDARVVVQGIDFVGGFSFYLRTGSALLLEGCRFRHDDRRAIVASVARGAILILESCDFSAYASPYLAYFLDEPAAAGPPVLYPGAGNAFGAPDYRGKRSFGNGEERTLKLSLR